MIVIKLNKAGPANQDYSNDKSGQHDNHSNGKLTTPSPPIKRLGFRGFD